MRSFNILLILFYYGVYAVSVQGKKKECKPDSENQEVRLMKDIFEKQDEGPLSSPINNFKERINVNLELAATRVQYYPGAGNGDDDSIVMDMQYTTTWKAPCLIWDPSKYGNIMKLHNVENKMWMPLFMLDEGLSDNYNFNFLMESHCSVYADGRVGCSHWHYFQLPCRESSYVLWPYDTNKCVLNILSDPTDEQAVDLDITTDDTFKETFSSGDWIVKSTKTVMYDPAEEEVTLSPQRKNNNTCFKIEINLKRDSGTIAAYIVYPTFVVSALTLTALCLHIYNFTKVYIAAVSLGFHIVVNVLITDELPLNCSDTPLLVAFVRDSLAFTSVVLLSSLLTYYLYHRADTPSGLAVAITNLCFYTRASVLIFYSAPIPNKGPKPENKGESSSDKIVADIDNSTIWVRLACIINCVVIFVIGFSYFVYMCALLQIPIENSK